MNKIKYLITLLLISCSTAPQIELEIPERLTSFSSLPTEGITNAQKCENLPRFDLQTQKGLCLGIVKDDLKKASDLSYYHHNQRDHFFILTQQGVTHLIFGKNEELISEKELFQMPINALLMGPDQLLYISLETSILRFDPFAGSIKLDNVVLNLPKGPRSFAFDEEGHLLVKLADNQVRFYKRIESHYDQSFSETKSLNSSPLIYDYETGALNEIATPIDHAIIYRGQKNYPLNLNNALLATKKNQIIKIDKDKIQNLVSSQGISFNALAESIGGEIYITSNNMLLKLGNDVSPRQCLIAKMPESSCQECQRDDYFYDPCSLMQAKYYYLHLESMGQIEEALVIKNFIEKNQALEKASVNTKTSLNVRSGPSTKHRVCAKIGADTIVIKDNKEENSFVAIRPIYQGDILEDNCNGSYYVHKDFLK